MRMHKPQPVGSFENLRSRVETFFKSPVTTRRDERALSLDLLPPDNQRASIQYPSTSIGEFINFMSDAMPQGDIYLFGGILRDLALYGRRGFSSDIDLVVEGDWSHCVNYLESLGAQQNKFGGYRFEIASWPVDIWNAQETWAIRKGLVSYRGIASLTETTILNWDAILMSWRTRRFIHRRHYLEHLRDRALDIVLEHNPNPLGMVTRVFRHLCTKDARRITPSAVRFLAEATAKYTFHEIMNEEIRSYANSEIQPPIYRLFEHFSEVEESDVGRRFSIASDVLRRELGLLPHDF